MKVAGWHQCEKQGDRWFKLVVNKLQGKGNLSLDFRLLYESECISIFSPINISALVFTYILGPYSSEKFWLAQM